MKAFCALLAGLIMGTQTTPALAYKIDATGRYLPFPGITVVSHTDPSELAIWESFTQELAKVPALTEHFAILPISSFHMTTTNLYTQSQFRSKEDWTQFISKHLKTFQQLHSYLEAHAFSPTVTIHSVLISGVIMLNLSVDEAQTHRIREGASSFSIQELVPPVFHITLAYQYKPLTADTTTALQRAIDTLVSDTFKKPGRTLRLQKPQLTYFYDMTAFTPWDASANPFASP